MTGYRLADAITKLKRPEAFKQATESAQSVLAAYSADEMEDGYRRRIRAGLEQCDSTMIERLGLTIDDLTDLKVNRSKRQAKGVKRQQAPDEYVETFARSAIESERNGETFADAIRRALQSLSDNHEHDMKASTARAWLKLAIECGAVNIDPPRKGRPKKNP